MEENVHFVEKDPNPENVLKAKPIENFGDILAQLVYEEGWEARTQEEFFKTPHY